MSSIDSGVNDYKTRIIVTGWTDLISAAVLTNKLNISLVSTNNFIQKCKDHAKFNYQFFVPIDTSDPIFSPTLELMPSQQSVARC